MNSFGSEIQKRFGTEHLYCIDHVLQLVINVVTKYKFGVTKGLLDDYAEEDNTDVDDDPAESHILKRSLTLVQYVWNSTQLTDSLKVVQGILEEYHNKEVVLLINDVVTRWWSTYDMVDCLLFLRSALHALYLD